jgi:ligand-binding SRPBCC domain-containing protein
MPTIRARGWVDAPVERVFAFFDDPANLGRLTPPPARVRLIAVDPAPPLAGSILEFRYGIGPWTPLRWRVRLLERVEHERFADTTLSGPMARFDHTHAFHAARRGTWVTDEITFHVGPGGVLGAAIDRLAGVAMRAVFVYRHALTRFLLARH